MKTILCPTDFSANATNAIEYAANLSLKFQSKLIILHVFETPMMNSEVPLTIIKNAGEEIRNSAGKKLKTLVGKILKINKSAMVETLLVEGSPSTKIVEIAQKKNVNLIITGTTGHSKLARLILGSTTSGLLHYSDCPVLCIPKESTFNGINKIVYATDLHEDNIGAAISITNLARLFDAEIIFVFIDDKHLIHEEQKVKEMANKIRKRVKYPKISGYICNSSNVSKGLEYFLKKHKAELLVMFTHKDHFSGLFFNQSVTRMVSHQTKVPLLSLKISEKTIIDLE
jgi:nucleotide-binding universal stress UspA family protein